MPTRNISLTDELEAFVERLVKSGEYQNASEAVREGLRALQRQRREAARKLKALRRAARDGVAALDRGEFKTFDSADDLKDYLRILSDKVLSR